jgi:hypothetical protein
VAAVEAALLGMAAEAVALEHNAHGDHGAHARRCMRPGSWGDAEPYRPTGYDGQNCGEQSRPLQTFGKQSTGRTGAIRSLRASAVLCCLNIRRQGDQQGWGQPRRKDGNYLLRESGSHRRKSGSRVKGRVGGIGVCITNRRQTRPLAWSNVKQWQSRGSGQQALGPAASPSGDYSWGRRNAASSGIRNSGQLVSCSCRKPRRVRHESRTEPPLSEGGVTCVGGQRGMGWVVDRLSPPPWEEGLTVECTAGGLVDTYV